jgi:hypothetical protein
MNGLFATPCRLQLKVEQHSQWQVGCLTAALRKRLGGMHIRTQRATFVFSLVNI